MPDLTQEEATRQVYATTLASLLIMQKQSNETATEFGALLRILFKNTPERLLNIRNETAKAIDGITSLMIDQKINLIAMAMATLAFSPIILEHMQQDIYKLAQEHADSNNNQSSQTNQEGD